MNSIPLVIVDEILTYVDDKSYCNFSRTCKSFSNIKNFDQVTKLKYLKRVERVSLEASPLDLLELLASLIK
jgi:hypothetical protein